MAGKVDTLKEIIEPVVASLGFELWGMQYMPQGNHSMLRIYIESENGVGVDDCANVSRQLSSVLDVEDVINEHYILEISSPGLDRPLFNGEQYSSYIGSEIKIKLVRAMDKRRKFRAELNAVDLEKNEIEITCDGEKVIIDLTNIDKANVVAKI